MGIVSNNNARWHCLWVFGDTVATELQLRKKQLQRWFAYIQNNLWKNKQVCLQGVELGEWMVEGREGREERKESCFFFFYCFSFWILNHMASQRAMPGLRVSALVTARGIPDLKIEGTLARARSGYLDTWVLIEVSHQHTLDLFSSLINLETSGGFIEGKAKSYDPAGLQGFGFHQWLAGELG